jgi:hypothetical protein
MSKFPIDDELPPAYEEASSSPVPQRQALNASVFTSHLAAHLETLPAFIRSSQQARTSQQSAADLAILSLLLPHIEDLLRSIGEAEPRPPTLSELILVPAAAVGRDWTISGGGDGRAGELHRLVRIQADKQTKESLCTKQSDNRPEPPESPSTKEFSSWGRWDDDTSKGASSGLSQFAWWWNDEAMAKRLARHLNPRTEPRVDRVIAKAAVETIKQEKKSSRWGLFRSSPEPTPCPTVVTTSSSKREELEEGVQMTVRPEEVTFRRENELGIWESMNGWGIIVRVKIRQGYKAS